MKAKRTPAHGDVDASLDGKVLAAQHEGGGDTVFGSEVDDPVESDGAIGCDVVVSH